MANEISTIEYKLQETIAFDYAYKSIEHTIYAGVELIKIKEKLPHGEFESWCEVNCRWKASQRQNVMRLAKEYGSKPHQTGFLDIDTEVALLKLFTDEQDREAPREIMEDMTQKERDKYLKMVADAKAEAQRAKADAGDWKSDGLKYRTEVRAKQDRIDTLEKQLAEQPKVVFQTDNSEAIRQATEEKEKQLADAKDQLKRTKTDFQKDVDRIVQRRLAEKSDELTKLQGEINYAQIQAQRAGQEYSDIVAKKDRTIEAQGILEAVQKSRFELIEKLDFLLTGELTKIQLTDLTGTLERYSELTNDSLIFIKKLNGANQ